jgi:hypothetical protein
MLLLIENLHCYMKLFFFCDYIGVLVIYYIVVEVYVYMVKFMCVKYINDLFS